MENIFVFEFFVLFLQWKVLRTLFLKFVLKKPGITVKIFAKTEIFGKTQIFSNLFGKTRTSAKKFANIFVYVEIFRRSLHGNKNFYDWYVICYIWKFCWLKRGLCVEFQIIELSNYFFKTYIGIGCKKKAQM